MSEGLEMRTARRLETEKLLGGLGRLWNLSVKTAFLRYDRARESMGPVGTDLLLKPLYWRREYVSGQFHDSMV